MCACPSNQDATRFGVSWGCGHGLGGGQACLALAALLRFGLWHTTSLSSSSNLLVLLPACCLFSLPPYPSLYFLLTLAWAGRSGCGCELISSSPGPGCGCGAGRRGHPFLLCLWLTPSQSSTHSPSVHGSPRVFVPGASSASPFPAWCEDVGSSLSHLAPHSLAQRLGGRSA